MWVQENIDFIITFITAEERILCVGQNVLYLNLNCQAKQLLAHDTLGIWKQLLARGTKQ